MTARKAPTRRRCTWRDCIQPAAVTVGFALPNLLAGSQREYCGAHAAQVCTAPGTRVVARFGPRQGEQATLPGLGDDQQTARPGRPGGRVGKGVVG